MKKILIIAFHFPPSSGAAVQRILSLCEDLPKFGWKVTVLTAKISAYGALDFSQEIPTNELEGLFRAWAIDAQRHLSIKGKHLGILSILDRWSSWIVDAVLKGRRIVKKQKIDIIMSTTPIPSANIIANYLSQKFDIPWIADFQDPFSYHYAEIGKLNKKIQQYVDNLTVKNCSAAVFATEDAKQSYVKKFDLCYRSKYNVVQNGFNDKIWKEVNKHTKKFDDIIDSNKINVLYSGVLYPNGRDPSNFFKALRSLKIRNIINNTNFEVIFQGSEGDSYRELIEILKIDDIVKFTPAVSYIDSLCCMKKAQILIVIQGDVFNLQVPGKIYEYIRAGKLILSLTPQCSATAKVTLSYPGGYVAETESEIIDLLHHLIDMHPCSIDFPDVVNYSRQKRNREFVEIFNGFLETNELS